MRQTLAIAKKELRAFFHHPLGWLLVAVFLILNHFFFFRTLYIANEATVRPMFEFLPWLLLFLIPATTMRALAEEERRGTAEIILAQPVSVRQYVAGKFLGLWALALLLVLATLTVPLSLASVGNLDWGSVAAQYLGGMLLSLALAAIGLFASSITKNQVLALLAAFSVTFAFILLGLEVVVLAVPPPLAAFIQQVALLPHFQNITRGALDLRDIGYFLALGAVFAQAAYVQTARRRLSPRGRRARSLAMRLGAVLTLAVLLVTAVSFWNFRLDLTRGKVFTLSRATKNLLRDLQKEITVTLFVSKHLPPQVASIERDARDLIRDYARASRGGIRVEIRHPDVDEQAKLDARAQGVSAVQFNILSKGEFQLKEGYLGIVASASPTKEVIPFVNKTDDFEYRLSSIIKKLTTDTPAEVGILSGSAGLRSGSYSAFFQELSRNYRLQHLALATSSSVPTSTRVLTVMGLERQLSSTEEAQVTGFLKNGGRALFLADGVPLNTRTLTVPPLATSAAAFIAPYGVRIQQDIVFDLRSNESVSFGGGFLSVVLPYPFWIRALPSPNSIITKDIPSVVLPWASSLDLEQSAIGQARVEELLTTTPFAGAQQDTFALLPNEPLNVDRDKLAKRRLAVALSNLRLEGSSQPSRIVVVGNSRFIEDGMVRTKPENLAFALNAIDWLSEDEGLLGIRSKSAAPRPLLFSSERQRDLIKYLNLAGMPALLTLAGAVVLIRRHRLTKRTYQTTL